MPVVPHIESLAVLAEQSATREYFSYALRDFLDGFYAEPEVGKLEAEPRFLKEVLGDDGYADAYLAATAEYLAQQFALPFPGWAQNPARILKEPVFAFKSDAGRMFLLVESPAAFRSRHIFISADALTRV